jgi:hypothetical protein
MEEGRIREEADPHSLRWIEKKNPPRSEISDEKGIPGKVSQTDLHLLGEAQFIVPLRIVEEFPFPPDRFKGSKGCQRGLQKIEVYLRFPSLSRASKIMEQFLDRIQNKGGVRGHIQG